MIDSKDKKDIEEAIVEAIRPLRERVEDLEQLNKIMERQLQDLRESFNKHMRI